MPFTLQELAAAANGELIGNPATLITGAAALPDAAEGEITFYNNARYAPLLRKSSATAVFVPRDFAEKIQPAQIRVDDPTRAFQQVVLRLAPPPITFAPGVHPTAIIAPGVKLGRGVSIQPYVVVESGCTIGDETVICTSCYIGHESTIGDNCLVHPQVTIRERTRIGNRVILHSGAVIGADGFGFDTHEGVRQKVEQLGIVQIDDDVEIGANTTIDRARFGRTWIKEGAKIDNLVQIGHNVVVGRHSAICAQVGIAGSSRVGDHVVMGGQAGVSGHLEIGDRNRIGGGSGVVRNIPAGSGTWWGMPALPLREMHQQQVWVTRLGRLFARVKAIEKKLGLSE